MEADIWISTCVRTHVRTGRVARDTNGYVAGSYIGDGGHEGSHCGAHLLRSATAGDATTRDTTHTASHMLNLIHVHLGQVTVCPDRDTWRWLVACGWVLLSQPLTLVSAVGFRQTNRLVQAEGGLSDAADVAVASACFGLPQLVC
jgi:hypothetical protein